MPVGMSVFSHRLMTYTLAVTKTSITFFGKNGEKYNPFKHNVEQ